MLTIHANIRYDSSPLFRVVLLIFSWLLGLFVGYAIYDSSYLPLMRSAVFQPVSIVGLFICIFLPLILSYYSILFEKPICILIVCFIKSVAFGFSCTLLYNAFGSASWLLRFLFLFSDTFFLFFLMALWLRIAYGMTRTQNISIHVCTIIGALIGTADYFVVSPLLERLF